MKIFNLRSPHILAAAAFGLFCLLILGAILFLRPGWGFMDDHNNLRVARTFWEAPSISQLSALINADAGIGRFQPLYKIWIIGAYHLGATSPWMIYFLITLIGLLALPVWGSCLDHIFNDGRRSAFWLFIYPLAFFIFLPFWNAFMYISIQEKFIYLFSAPAVLLFLRAYARGSWTDLSWALAFVWMAVLSKETGIAIFLAFAAYAFLDATIFKRRPQLSWILWAVCSSFFLVYYLFIRKLLCNYTAKYATGISASGFIHNLLSSPIYIKIIFCLSVLILAGTIIRRLVDPAFQEKGRTLFAWLSLFYILILLPWGFPTYLLPPLAVFAAGASAPVFILGDRWPTFQLLKRCGLLVLAFLVALFIVIPQIEKMADKRKAVEAVQRLNLANPAASFFYPAPYSETATALRVFTHTEIVYLENSTISPELLKPAYTNYLLMNDECHPAQLHDVFPARTVYQNSTWKIYELEPRPGHNTTYKEERPRNAVQRLSSFIKKL